jgi:ADP-ribose pyrophosphatase YjhB (NUDIX family)
MSWRPLPVTSAEPGPIRTVAAVIADARGRVLVVRKHGSSVHIQPGGKPEPGEAPLAALDRELAEELGVTVVPGSARLLGEFEDEAVHEPGRRVRANAYAVAIDGIPQARAEIAALAWIDPRPPHDVLLAPLSARHILPAWLEARGQT